MRPVFVSHAVVKRILVVEIHVLAQILHRFWIYFAAGIVLLWPFVCVWPQSCTLKAD